MRNDYGDLVAPWKMDLLAARARRKGFRTDELEDAEQEIVLAMMSFRFEPERSNGATEATALTALIDNQLTFIQRGWARLRKHETCYRELLGGMDERTAEDAQLLHSTMASDVRKAVAGLTPREQTACEGLSRDEPRHDIARSLGVSRYEVDRLIDGLRGRFEALGLGDWMVGP